MPTYHARNITIRLMAADLASSTSPIVHRSRTGTVSQTEADRCEDIFQQQGQPLLETPVPCDDDGRSLHILEAASPVPLFVVQANRARFGPTRAAVEQARAAAPPEHIGTRSTARLPDASPDASAASAALTSFRTIRTRVSSRLSDRSTDAPRATPVVPAPRTIGARTSSRRSDISIDAAPAGPATPARVIPAPRTIGSRTSSRLSDTSRPGSPTSPLPPRPVDPSAGPYALALHISLPRALFSRDHCPRKPSCDVRYDVFFNGAVAASDLFSVGKLGGWRGRPAALVSGSRVDFHVERPWVVVPDGQDAAGRLVHGGRRSPRALTMGQRWGEVNTLLREQAAETQMLQGGARTPVLDCLYALAGMEMPAALEEIPTTGKKAGIIDVIISIGEGKKGASTSYLRVPEMMPNHKKIGVPSILPELDGLEIDDPDPDGLEVDDTPTPEARPRLRLV
jgi:hypothetical protein